TYGRGRQPSVAGWSMLISLKETNNDVQGLYPVAANIATPVSQTLPINISYHQSICFAANLFFFKEKTINLNSTDVLDNLHQPLIRLAI
ncbi:MAG: hypothetical protein OQK04_05895, partial [Kangiellaceae bacterium]|nr:hypothetical protein [Kangiellaceae bacterium]